MHSPATDATHYNRDSSTLVWISAAAALIGLVVPMFLQNDETGIRSLFGLGVFQFLPLLISISRGAINYLDLVLPTHFLQFTLPRIHAYYSQEQEAPLPPEIMTGLHEVTICTFLIVGVYYLARFGLFLHRWDTDFRNLYISPRTRLILLFIVFLHTLVGTQLPASLMAIMSQFITVACVLIVATVPEGNPMKERATYALLVGCGFVSLLQIGFLTFMVNIFSIFLIFVFVRRKYGALKWVVVFFITMTVIQSVKYGYRNTIESEKGDMLSFLDRIDLFSSLLESRFIDNDAMTKDAQQQILTDSFARIGDYSLETVLQQTPSMVPFWNGETYETILYMFIPRLFWPEKPSRDFFHKFGLVYGYLGADDAVTSIAVGFLGEGYMNFGYKGLYGIAIIFAFLMALMEWFAATVFQGRTVFGFTIFLVPFMQYAFDFGTIINMQVIFIALVLGVRWLLGLEHISDAYGARYTS